jgi:predicted PurR-regulated permease PerM
LLRFELTYRGALLGGLALLSLWALVRIWPVLILVATAFIFMAALLPYVEWLVRHGFSRAMAVLLLVFAVFIVLIGVFAIVVPAMIEEFQDLRDDLPEDARETEEFLAGFNIDVELEERARQIDWGRLVDGRAAVGYAERALVVALSLLTIIVMTAYLLVDAPRLSTFLYQFVTPGHEPDVERALQAASRVVGGYVRGQFITSVAIGVYTFVVMFALGIPNAVAFGVLAAFADIIPLIGATIATAPPTIAALQESPGRGLAILGLLLLYQQFEDRFFTPRVYGSTLNLPPIIVLLAILIGAELLGITGVLLALPAAALARVTLDYYLDARRSHINLTPPGPSQDVLAPDTPGE